MGGLFPLIAIKIHIDIFQLPCQLNKQILYDYYGKCMEVNGKPLRNIEEIVYTFVAPVSSSIFNKFN